jgi:hypothetical protein
MMVTPGPFTLRTRIGAVMATRLGKVVWTALPPVSYVPLVTSTVSPALAASTASWIDVAAVNQSP